jgi:hypothetical protein
MVQVLDYAAPARPINARSLSAAGLLAAGTVLYALLCWPAMTRRGYPPIDYLWIGVTYLWVFPVPHFTLICPPGKFSRRVLTAYALATAYIDGCTVVMLVPHRFDPGQGILLIPFFGPIHLAGVAALAWFSRVVYRYLEVDGCADANDKAARPAIRKFFVWFAILAIAAAFPFLYRKVGIAMDMRAGVERADGDWANHSAYILNQYGWMMPQSVGNYDVYSYFDAASGLPLRSDHQMGYEVTYKARIQDLLKSQGVPPWSHRAQLVPDGILIDMLAAKDFTPVTTYPFDVSPHVVLSRGGVLSRWGGTFSSGTPDLYVYTENGGDFGQNYNGDAEIGRLPAYPGVIFVRGGDQWIAAVSDDGWILKTASISQ